MHHGFLLRDLHVGQTAASASSTIKYGAIAEVPETDANHLTSQALKYTPFRKLIHVLPLKVSNQAVQPSKTCTRSKFMQSKERSEVYCEKVCRRSTIGDGMTAWPREQVCKGSTGGSQASGSHSCGIMLRWQLQMLRSTKHLKAIAILDLIMRIQGADRHSGLSAITWRSSLGLGMQPSRLHCIAHQSFFRISMLEG